MGSDGTIALARLREPRHRPDPGRAARAATRSPVDPLKEGERNAIEYVLGCIAAGGEPVGGPLDPGLCLTAQRIVDTAAQSAALKRTLELIP